MLSIGENYLKKKQGKKMTSGIYRIINKTNKHMYLGSSIHIERRFSVHKQKLKSNTHHSKYLQNAVNKYGLENFDFEIMFIRDPDQLFDFETFLIKEYTPEYNMTFDALAPMRFKKHTIETKEKFKCKVYKKGKDHPFFGRKLPTETLEKMSKAHLGSHRSDETKQKMSDTAKKVNSISRIDWSLLRKVIIDNYGNTYISLTDASKKTGCSIQSICDNLKGRSFGTRNGYQFKYENEKKEFIDVENSRYLMCKTITKEQVIEIKKLHKINF